MRVTFYVAAFFAIICSLQHMVLADDGAVPSAEAPEVPADKVAKSAGDYEPDSEEYLKHMEELSRKADEEGGDKVPTSEHDKAAFEEMEKLMAAEEAAGDSVVKEIKDEDAGLSLKDAEKGMEEPPVEEEEEIVLPTKYPEINPDMTHVSLVEHVNDEAGEGQQTDEVHLTLEHSYFKGADKYELCGNCIIDGGKRLNADTDGQVKAWAKGDELFCEHSPACFQEFKWKSGGHTFSMRAHTDKGWTDWSPNYNFHINREVGPVTHVHEDL